MSRATRLLELLQLLRRHRQPVRGAALAQELSISVRTLYRDIASLQAQGAAIAGEAGVGYVLRPGFTLPPLMFSEEEIEALVLGSRWVASRTDARLALAARNSLAKIAAVVPFALREDLEHSALLVGGSAPDVPDDPNLPLIRQAIRQERKLAIAYRDANGRKTERTIWPLAIGFFDQARVVAAWCETRNGFRHFRTDRLARVALSADRYPRRRRVLLQEWRAAEGIPES